MCQNYAKTRFSRALCTNGSSERFVGQFIKDHRQSIVLGTKYSNAMPGSDPNAAGNHRKNMMQALDASLSRLQTDYIDLYWVHIWDQMTPVDEVMRGLDNLVRQGKILCRYFRCSGVVGRAGEYRCPICAAGLVSRQFRLNTVSAEDFAAPE